MLDRLERPDRHAELGADLRVLDGGVESPPGDAALISGERRRQQARDERPLAQFDEVLGRDLGQCHVADRGRAVEQGLWRDVGDSDARRHDPPRPFPIVGPEFDHHGATLDVAGDEPEVECAVGQGETLTGIARRGRHHRHRPGQHLAQQSGRPVGVALRRIRTANRQRDRRGHRRTERAGDEIGPTLLEHGGHVEETRAETVGRLGDRRGEHAQIGDLRK